MVPRTLWATTLLALTLAGSAQAQVLVPSQDGRRVDEIHPDGRRAATVLDRQGRLARVELPSGRRVEYDHTRRGVRQRVHLGRTLLAERRYDSRGKPVYQRDSRGHAVRYRWDEEGRLVEARDRLGVLASLEWSGDRLTRIADAGGSAIRYAEGQDGEGQRFLALDDETRGPALLRFDAAGRVTEVLRGQHRLGYRYDAQGRMVRRVTPAGAEEFRYDGAGRVVSTVGPEGGYRLAYDADGRVTRLINTRLNRAIDYRYDDAGRRSEVRLPWGTLRYRYDRRGHLAALITPRGERIAFRVRRDGRRAAIRYPNGVTTRFAYRGPWLVGVETRDEGGELIAERRYTWEGGRVVAASDHRGRAVSLAYDARGRLVSAGERRYAYDAAGNRLDGDAQIGPGNQLLRQGERSFAYGPTGALSESVTPHGKTRFTYDHDDRLVEVELPDGERIRYGYAPNGMRLWREGATGRLEYLHDMTDVVGVYRGDELQVSFTHGPEVDDVLAAERRGQAHYYHYDLVRSVVAMTGAQGRVTARYGYDPFGASTHATGPATAWNPYRYTSRAHDPATGLYHYRARTYDPHAGRFLSPDPSGRAGGLNLYAYAANAPTQLNDPTGLFPSIPNPLDLAGDVAGTVGGGIVDVARGGLDLGGEALELGGEAIAFGRALGLQAIEAGVELWKLETELRLAFHQGVVQGLWGGLRGTYEAIRHPIQTAQGIYWLLNNPEQAALLLGQAAVDYFRLIGEDPREFVRQTGYLTGEVLLAVAGSKGTTAAVSGVRNAASAARGARAAAAVAGASDDLARGGAAAGALDDAARVAPLPQRRGILGALADEAGRRSLAHTVLEATSRPLPAAARARFAARWQRIQERAAALADARARARPGTPEHAALSEVDDALRTERLNTSSTARRAADDDPISATATANYDRADDLVARWIDDGEPITVERIQQLNRELGQGLPNNGNAPGTIRGPGGDVFAGPLQQGRVYVPGSEVDDALRQFDDWLQGAQRAGTPAPELAAGIHQRLISIHPFFDANGRTARLVQNWALQRAGLPPVAVSEGLAVFGTQTIPGVPAIAANEAITSGLESALDAYARAGLIP